MSILLIDVRSKMKGAFPRVKASAIALASLRADTRPPAVILLANKTEAGTGTIDCAALAPTPVFIVPICAAAVQALPSGWHKFQFVDFVSRTLWLIEANQGRVVSATNAPFVKLERGTEIATRHFAAIGFRHIATTGGTLSEGRELSGLAINEGAIRALSASSRNIRLQATREIDFNVVNSRQPVFSLDEPVLAQMASSRPIVLIVDEQVYRNYGTSIDAYAAAQMFCVGKYILRATEKQKSVVTVARICKHAASLNFPRQGIFVAVGGGITLDVAGFAASAYRRGIGYLRVPTTLIGMIDAGLGIKQAVNFAGKKNLLGAFYPPLGVINDPSFLATLPRREISCGLAEIIKIALVRDRYLFEILEAHGRQLLRSHFTSPPIVAREILLRSATQMVAELQPNLFELNLRRYVDFGHTFSPLIETHSGFKIPHGFAVAMDMMLSTAIGVAKRICPIAVLDRLASLCRDVDLPDTLPNSVLRYADGSLRSARQHRSGALNLVVPSGIGEGTFVQDVSRSELAEASRLLANVGALSQEFVEIHASVGV